MRTKLIVIVCVLGLFGAAFAIFRAVDRSHAQPARDLSKMMSVRLVVSEALSAYQRRHGSYPRSLTELPLQTLRWGDEGSSAQDVERWSYVSAGSAFTMTWTNARGVELFLSGRDGQMFYSKAESR